VSADGGQVETFIAKIKDGYEPYKNLEGDALREVIFATKPSSGACGKLTVSYIAFLFLTCW
jgi:hypothetical protein